jgi:hypothetical protein
MVRAQVGIGRRRATDFPKGGGHVINFKKASFLLRIATVFSECDLNFVSMRTTELWGD